VNVRIIAGTYGGRIIVGSGTRRTHPMGERIRNALFNKIQHEMPGADVLDVFAGSGALGLESLSRGAKHVTFVEKDRVAQKVIAKNILKLDVEEQTTLIRSAASPWLNLSEEFYDIIFADPPYYDPQFSTVKDLFALLKPNGLMVLSYPGSEEAPTETGVVVVDNRSYGNASLAFYRKKGA